MFKTVQDGYIVAFGKPETEEETQEYLMLVEIFKNKPIPREGYDYRLKDITYEWVEFKLPEPEPEPNEETDQQDEEEDDGNYNT